MTTTTSPNCDSTCIPPWALAVAVVASSIVTLITATIILWCWANCCRKDGRESSNVKSRNSKKQKSQCSDRPPGSAVLDLGESKESAVSPPRRRKRGSVTNTTSFETGPENGIGEAPSGFTTASRETLPTPKSLHVDVAPTRTDVKTPQQEDVFATGNSQENLQQKPKQPKTNEPSTMDLLRTSLLASTVKK